jgi:hypothetical protein
MEAITQDPLVNFFVQDIGESLRKDKTLKFADFAKEGVAEKIFSQYGYFIIQKIALQTAHKDPQMRGSAITSDVRNCEKSAKDHKKAISQAIEILEAGIVESE